MRMNPLVIPAVSLVTEKERESRHQEKKAVDLKVQDVSSRVSLPRVKESCLLGTAVDPSRQMIPPNGKMGYRVEWEPRRKKKKPGLSENSLQHIPIGLRRSDPYPWINALMQFLLFVPTCREILSYIPKSLQGIREFSDRYFCDLDTEKGVSSADGVHAAGSLLNKFPNLFREENRIVNLDEALQLIWESASSVQFKRPSWQMLWDSSETLFVEESAASAFEWVVGLEKLYESSSPQDLFHGNCLQRQVLLEQASSYMEMDAFIEARPDEGEKISYFAYLKVGGSWVQCADEKVLFLRSSRSLELPLQRGVLFHFRRVSLR